MPEIITQPINGKSKIPPENEQPKKDVYATDLMAKMPYNILDTFIPFSLMENPDPVLQLEAGKGIAVYEDMTLHPVIDACWVARKAPINGMEWDILSISESSEDILYRDFVLNAFRNLNSKLWKGNAFMGGFAAFLDSIMDSIRMGYSISQALWNFNEGIITETKHELPQGFTFLPDEEEKDEAYSQYVGTDLYFRSKPSDQPIPAPPLKFMHFCYRPEYGNPWGRSGFRAAYWPWLFGFIQGWKMWHNFIDKWAQPMLLGLIDEDLWNDDNFVQKFMKVLTSFQTAFAATLPYAKDGKEPVKILESNRSATHNVFGEYTASMNRTICMTLVGAPLVMMEAEYGTRAQAGIQYLVREDFVKADVDYVQTQIQIPIRWMIDTRFGPNENRQYPEFKFKYQPPKDLLTDIQIDEKLVKMVAIPASYIYDHYGRPQPAYLTAEQEAKRKEREAMPTEPLAKAADPAAPAIPGPPVQQNLPFSDNPNPAVTTRVSSVTPNDDIKPGAISAAELPNYRQMLLSRGSKKVQNFLRKQK